MNCDAKHTKYQPSDEEFCCPRCGTRAGNFCIDEGPNNDCDLLHEDDSLVCFGVSGQGCPGQYYVSGKAFAAGIVRKKNLVPCPHCKGSGYVQRKS